MKIATVKAITVCVYCPHCHEPQGNPRNGSHLWDFEDFYGVEGGAAKCRECGGEMKVTPPKRVDFEGEGGG
jgi:hypothetical protein